MVILKKTLFQCSKFKPILLQMCLCVTQLADDPTIVQVAADPAMEPARFDDKEINVIKLRLQKNTELVVFFFLPMLNSEHFCIQQKALLIFI